MDANSILQAINTLAGQYANEIPLPQVPSLDFVAPNVGDISDKWQEFLDRAQKDPDIVKYYNNLLDQAKGDTKLAISFLEKDYTMGVRQTTDNLSATLAQLGLTSTQEQNTLQNNLNQRQIALTDVGGGKTAYAAGGRPATELGQLNEGQKLRQEAEQRSASQGIEKMGLSRQKGITSAGQQLQQYGTDLNKNKQSDILNRAQTYFGAYQNQQSADLANQQNQQALGNVSGGSNLSDTQKHINPSSGVWDDNYFANTGKYL